MLTAEIKPRLLAQQASALSITPLPLGQEIFHRIGAMKHLARESNTPTIGFTTSLVIAR